MVPFAAFEMPLHYPGGIMAEHLHTRTLAGLFDVSHMGQARLDLIHARTLETLVPGDILSLKPGEMRYTLLTLEAGGILDDLMVTHAGDHFLLVVNAARKVADFAHIGRSLPLTPLPDRALLALQGPASASVLERLAPGIGALSFMTGGAHRIDGAECFVTRSGYTGEDGFEISLPGLAAMSFAQRLLQEREVKPIGLGARDSLRLEAGLCLYGHDIDETTTILEASLGWVVSKRRRGEGGFPGADVFARERDSGPKRCRVGILPEGRAPAREGTEILDDLGNRIGTITSGGFGPSVDGPIAMGLVNRAAATLGTRIGLLVRGVVRPARIAPLPFVPHRYHRKRHP